MYVYNACLMRCASLVFCGWIGYPTCSPDVDDKTSTMASPTAAPPNKTASRRRRIVAPSPVPIPPAVPLCQNRRRLRSYCKTFFCRSDRKRNRAAASGAARTRCVRRHPILLLLSANATPTVMPRWSTVVPALWVPPSPALRRVSRADLHQIWARTPGPHLARSTAQSSGVPPRVWWHGVRLAIAVTASTGQASVAVQRWCPQEC